MARISAQGYVPPEQEPDDGSWEGCTYPYPDHDWMPGDLECRRCQADLSEWNDEYDEEAKS